MTKTTEQVPSMKSGMIAIFHRNPIAYFTKIFMAVLLLALTAMPGGAFAGKYDNDIENLKFRYGAFSTLVSSYVLGVMCRDIKYQECNGLIELLNDPYADLGEIEKKIGVFKKLYESLSDEEVDKIIKLAREDQTSSIYEEERSVVSTLDQNKAFNIGMAEHQELNPVDYLVDNGNFKRDNFQFSIHRALYNDAFGIPQNSLAAIVNAYVAGIRNVEFDVLDTNDNVSILIHDLVTNRIEGDYRGHPKYVEDLAYDHVKDTAVNVLNPLGNQPTVENTNVKMIATERVLEVVHELMPKMTLYLDARNNAPLSIIRMLKIHPEYKNHVVLKIYPFLLNGGMTDLVKRYADRYMDGYVKAARDEIASVNPNVLLAIGHAEMEANQDAAHSGINDFTWKAFQDQKKLLPFKLGSTYGDNIFSNKPLFSEEELNEIEMRTFLLFRWTMGLTGITNTMVFQMAAIPSLIGIITRSDFDEYAKMIKNDKKENEENREYLISAAIHDNFIELYKKVMNRDLSLIVDGRMNEFHDLQKRIEHTKFGLSDRYPDFAFANRVELNGNPDTVYQDTLQSFNYNMLGTGYKTVGYQPEKVRSTRAIMDRITELNLLTGNRVRYITTDLEIDLRLAFMGLLGQHGLPEDIRYRAGGVIKEGKYDTTNAYALPTWLTRLSGDKHLNDGPNYKLAFDAISDAQKEIDKLRQMLHSLRRAHYDGLPITNKDVWQRLKTEKISMNSELSVTSDLLINLIGRVDEEITTKQQAIQKLKRAFARNYRVRFITERSIQD